MDVTTKARWGATSLVIAPVVLLASFLTHPRVGNPVDPGFAEAVAVAVAANPTAWAFSHLMAAVGSGLVALAFLALRGYLREAGEDRWSAVGLPFVVFGSVMFALLPAMELAPVAAADAGLDIAAVQRALGIWFLSVLVIGSAIFAVGGITFALGVVRSVIMRPAPARIVAGLLVAVAATRFIPLTAVVFYVQSAALIAALWTLAYVMWTRPKVTTVRGTLAAS